MREPGLSGSTDTLELRDNGRDLFGVGDDLADDGIFTGVYRNTQMKGAYTFLLRADIEKWRQSGDFPHRNLTAVSPRFVREVRLSAAVGDPRDVEQDLEDPPRGPDKDKWRDWLWLLILLLALAVLLVCAFLVWRRIAPRGRESGLRG